MFKRIILIVFVILLVFASNAPTQANNSCRAYIIDQPQGLGLPVFEEPSYLSQFVGVNLEAGQSVTVYEVSFNPVDGQIWFRIDSGWLQSYSGFTTGTTQITLSDFDCILPYQIVEK